MGGRSRLEASMEILDALKQGIHKPTHLMFAADLQWIRFQSIIGGLVENNLVRYEPTKPNRREYFITERGLKALELWKELLWMVRGEKP